MGHPFDESVLCTAGNDAYLQTFLLDLAHQFRYSVHDRCRGQQAEHACFLIVHALCFGFIDIFVLLLFYEHTDRIHAAHALCGVCLVGRHAYSVAFHCLFPRRCMVGHGVVEHTIHIEKHDLWGKRLVAVLF